MERALGGPLTSLFYLASQSWRKRVGHTDRQTEFLKYRPDPPVGGGSGKNRTNNIRIRIRQGNRYELHSGHVPHLPSACHRDYAPQPAGHLLRRRSAPPPKPLGLFLVVGVAPLLRPPRASGGQGPCGGSALHLLCAGGPGIAWNCPLRLDIVSLKCHHSPCERPAG
jgi:hypothetical protein